VCIACGFLGKKSYHGSEPYYEIDEVDFTSPKFDVLTVLLTKHSLPKILERSQTWFTTILNQFTTIYVHLIDPCKDHLDKYMVRLFGNGCTSSIVVRDICSMKDRTFDDAIQRSRIIYRRRVALISMYHPMSYAWRMEEEMEKEEMEEKTKWICVGPEGKHW
jgi:hypothetical protein